MGCLLGSGSGVGLELDTGEARVVQFQGNARNPEVSAWGRIALPDGAVEDGMVAQPEAVGEALAELWSESGITGRDVVVGVFNQSVLVRFAAFPKVPRDKLDKVIRYQAQDYLPIPLAGVVLDYAVIGETVTDAGPQVEVLLVAAQRDMLDGFLSGLEAARLSPKDIDVSSLALLRILPKGAASGTTAVVNIANGLSSIIVAAQGVPRLARLMPVGLRNAAEMLGCSLREVVPDGGPPSAESVLPADDLLPWSTSLAGEIRSSIGYYEAQTGVAVDRIILSGRGARLKGLSAQLQENLGAAIECLDPLHGVSIPDGGRAGISYEASDYAVSIGLARRGLEA